MMVDMSFSPLIFAVFPIFSTFVGGYAVYRWKRDLHPWLSLSGGVLLGVAFLDLLPEALSLAGRAHIDDQQLLLATLGAIILLHLIDTVFRFHGHHEHAHGQLEEPCGNEMHIHAKAWVRAGGLVLHSLCDGLAIGGGFAADVRLGLFVTMAVVLHDFSDGMSTVTILRNAFGPKHRTILPVLALDAIAPFVGSFVGLVLAPSVGIIAYLLAGFSGMFIFLALSELLPLAHAGKLSRHASLGLTLIGVIFVYIVRFFAPV